MNWLEAVDGYCERVDASVWSEPLNATTNITFLIASVWILRKDGLNGLSRTLAYLLGAIGCASFLFHTLAQAWTGALDVVFIFATTETEKVPVTILSRCQRFILRRVDLKLIADHLIKIAKNEGYSLDQESAQIISKCSEGSMRDSLSMLDNVLARNEPISPELVRNVIGLTDNTQCMDLFESLCQGNVKASLEKFQELYEKGISIDELAKSLMKLTYNLALTKSEFENGFDFLDGESIKKLKNLSEKFEMDFITRFWEVMQKYLNEPSDTFDEKQCFEMAIMRICYISLTPTPFEALLAKNKKEQKVEDGKDNNHNLKGEENISRTTNTPDLLNNNLALKKKILVDGEANNTTKSNLEKFSELVGFLEGRSEMLIAYHLRNSFRLVSFSELEGDKPACHIELQNIGDNKDAQNILWKASKVLGELTKKRWILSITNKTGHKSLEEIKQLDYKKKIDQLKKEETIKKILDIIPSSEVTSVIEIVKENNKKKD